MSRNDIVNVEVEECKVSTEAALLCEIEGEDHWIPKSLIDGGDVQDQHDYGTVYLPRWFCEDNEIPFV